MLEPAILKANTPLAWDEFKLTERNNFTYKPSAQKIVLVNASDSSMKLQGKNFTPVFDKAGNFISYKVGNKTIFNAGPKINFWRPPK